MALSAKQVKFLGIWASLPTNTATPNLDLFTQASMPTTRTSISWDDITGGNHFAELVPRGERGKSLNNKRPTSWSPVRDPGPLLRPEMTSS